MESSTKSMKAEYNSAIENAKIMAFSQVVSRHREISLKDLADFANEVGLQHLTLGDLADLPRSPEEWRKRLSLVPAKASKALASGVNTRTPKGREEFAKKIHEFLMNHEGWVSAPDVGNSCGGTPLQVRKALNTLIEDGAVDYKGRARGTRYRSVKKAKRVT